MLVYYSEVCRQYGSGETGLAPLRGPFPWISESNQGLSGVAKPPLFVVMGPCSESELSLHGPITTNAALACGAQSLIALRGKTGIRTLEPL